MNAISRTGDVPYPARPQTVETSSVPMDMVDVQNGSAPTGKLTASEVRARMQAAQTESTETLSIRVGGRDVSVRIHGAQPEELANIRKSLEDLAAHDHHDLILRQVHDVYVTDSLGQSEFGPVLGKAVPREGATDIVLARNPGQSVGVLNGLKHVKRVLYHEIAHACDRAYMLSGRGPFGEGDKSRIGSDGDFVTRYASTNASEDFAETFSDYFQGRTSPSMKGMSDHEVVDVLAWGFPPGQVATKMHSLVDMWTPDHHLRAFILDDQERQRWGGNMRGLIRGFYDDEKFRGEFVDAVQGRHPAMARADIYRFMGETAELFGEAAYPGG